MAAHLYPVKCLGTATQSRQFKPTTATTSSIAALTLLNSDLFLETGRHLLPEAEPSTIGSIQARWLTTTARIPAKVALMSTEDLTPRSKVQARQLRAAGLIQT
jgi:hypothetical protein